MIQLNSKIDIEQKAIFLDRDGVINIEKDYLYKIEDFEFIDGVFDSLKYLQSLGYKLFIITNQSGIGKGYYSKTNFTTLTTWMLKQFKLKNIDILQVEFCPHMPSDRCECRKPLTGMIDNIIKNHDINLEKSWLIGDKSSDIMCAKNANIKNTIQVQSGHIFDKKSSRASFVTYSIKNIQKFIKS
jgi:D-glycero-D-manno-heptose 1,7-bisphosphate phosphatase